MEVYESKEYKRGRTGYIMQSAFDYFISIMITDAFLAKLLTSIGISDALAGIIASFISFAFLFQLLSIALANRIRNTKYVVSAVDFLSQVCFISIYTVPFMNLSMELKSAITVILVIAAYMMKYVVSSIYFKWANSFVDPLHRAEFSAGKEIISLLGGIVFTLAMGYIVDAFDASGNTAGGFIFIAAVMLVLNILNFASFMMIPNEPHKEEKKAAPKGALFKNTFGNKSFRNVVIMTALWEIGRYSSYGFMGTFKTNDLLISVSTIQIINTAANIIRMIVSKPFGRFSDKFSYAKGFELAFAIAGTGFLLNFFTTPKTWWIIIIFTVLYYVSLAGTNQNSSNIMYSYVDSDYIVQAIAIKNSIAGVLGFAASLGASRILSWVQANGNTVFGIPMYGQQLLSGISFVIILIALLFTKLVIEKQKTMVQ
ncbi:MAG: MFS transporter [Clostridia bacterium]|nr:MFS transporter [Clostridia bacterium]